MSLNLYEIFKDYEGNKDWSELSPTEQDKILINELSNSNDENTKYIESTNWLKDQAVGLKCLFADLSLILEKNGLISNAADWDENHKKQIIQFLEGSNLGNRLKETLSDQEKAEKRTTVNGNEFLVFSDKRRRKLITSVKMTEVRILIHYYLSQIPKPKSDNLLKKYKLKPLTHKEFYNAYEAGKIIIYVNKILATHVAKSGVPIGNVAPLFAHVFTLSVIALIPVTIFYGWIAGVTIFALIIISKKVFSKILVSRIRQLALDDETLYNIFMKNKVIWYEWV